MSEIETAELHLNRALRRLEGVLARRLVENGVRFVEVQSGGWDMHKQLEDSMEDRGAEFDRTFAALVVALL